MSPLRNIPLGTRVEATVARAIMRLPVPVLSRFVGARPTSEGVTLDVPTATLLRLHRLARRPALETLPLAQARQEMTLQAGTFAGAPASMRAVRDRTLPGPGGPIPIRVYEPPDVATPSGALLFFHGGGWVVGDLESHDSVCRLLAAGAGCRVVAVDYRLGPEHRFPAGVEDAVAAFRALVAEAEVLGIDPERIAVGGDSAGGNLSAVLCQLVRAQAGPRPVFQLLAYPGTDLTLSMPSQKELSEGFWLTNALMRWFLSMYFRSPDDARDPRASPLFAADLSGLPPAMVITAGFDPLRDEGRAYAERLEEAGGEVVHRHYPTTFHGFFSLPGVLPAGREAHRDAAAALRRHLETAP